MDLLRDTDIDPSPLEGKRIAIIGFGNQGRAQSLNLKDSGADVTVGLRPKSANAIVATEFGLSVETVGDAAAKADIVMLLAPDEVLGSIYRSIEPVLRTGTALGFSHGLAIHFKQVVPRADLDVFMVAPKGPGTALRSLYEAGEGMIALWGIAQDATGSARALALAYGRAIGCGRAGLIASTFAEECEADLFNENAVVWGSVPELLIAGFDTLVEAGISPEVAYLECVGELSLIAGLIEARGIAGMREAISNTAELGGTVGGPRIIDESVRARMKHVFADIRSGKFAADLEAEAASAYPKLTKARADARGLAIEAAYERLSAIRPGP